LFAICFSLWNVLQLSVSTTNQVYSSVAPRFLKQPWLFSTEDKQSALSSKAERYFRDIRTTDDVYLWLLNVFVPALYGSKPALGDESYCGTSTKCLLGEGRVTPGQKQCHEYLQEGKANCNLWMGPGAACCEPCENRAVTGGAQHDSQECPTYKVDDVL
ncbi:unnamed protein product, partial [Amoebophrya sp. A25]